VRIKRICHGYSLHPPSGGRMPFKKINQEYYGTVLGEDIIMGNLFLSFTRYEYS
jgi:hypothetical protein